MIDALWKLPDPPESQTARKAMLRVRPGDVGGDIHVGAWIMKWIDVAVRGRVRSVLMLASFGITPISLAVAGFLVAWSLKLMFLLAGGLTVLTAAGASFQKPVREIE